MCTSTFLSPPGKCGRLSNRCVLWVLNRKIIKRHLTIRGLHSNITSHHFSRTLHNAVALIESIERTLCKLVRKKKSSPCLHHTKIENPFNKRVIILSIKHWNILLSLKGAMSIIRLSYNLYLWPRTSNADGSQHSLWYIIGNIKSYFQQKQVKRA